MSVLLKRWDQEPSRKRDLLETIGWSVYSPGGGDRAVLSLVLHDVPFVFFHNIYILYILYIYGCFQK